MKKRTILLITSIIVFILVISGGTYAYIRKSSVQNTDNEINTLNCLEMTFEDKDINGNSSNAINLTDAYPIEDYEGLNQTPYSFTITNTCTTPVLVDINIEALSDSKLGIDKVKLNYKNVGEDYNYTSKISEYPASVQKVISNSLANTNKQLDRVFLAGNDPEVNDITENSKKTFEIKLWIDKDTSWADAHETVNNVEQAKDYKGKITIIESPVKTYKPNWNAESGTLLAALENGNYLFSNAQTIPGQSISNRYERVIAKTEDDYGTSYYFRGNIENNYVLFADKCWRIVRVDGNNNIKLWLWNNTDNCTEKYVPSSQFNSSNNNNNNNNAYVGYMYGDVNSTEFSTGDLEHPGVHDNVYPSTIFQNLATWYDNTFYTSTTTKYTDLLADVIWCGDKKPTTTGANVGIGTTQTYYGFYGRQNNPTLKCQDLGVDGNLSRYTAYSGSDEPHKDANNAKGNGALKITKDGVTKYYKAGLLTADEVRLAGEKETNSSYYLYTGSWYWLMSPCRFSGSAVEWDVGYYGYLGSDYVTGSFGLRPSVSLKGTVEILSGDGTIEKPYQIKVPNPVQNQG